MKVAVRFLRVLLASFLCLSAALGYYHFNHYTSKQAPYFPIPEKFDLAALPNKTLTFYVSEAGPTTYLPDDNFLSVLSQIQAATQAWNSVETSELRVAFGGPSTIGPPQSTPAGDITFEELPPGILGFGGPTYRAEPYFGPNGAFVPITRAVVQLNRNLTQRPGPSHSEAFFATTLHEMGHALGLQHAMTSSAMSTERSRAISRVRPLEADDVAALSLLYPSPKFSATTGTITGRVTSSGNGVHLASVVALRPAGGAISALTHPDGTYRLQGVPPGQYLVYVHPLPPPRQAGLGPSDIVLPVDPDGQSVPAGEAFETLFYPGVRDPNEAVPIAISAGGVVESVSFAVGRRSAPGIYDVTTYSFFGQSAVQPGVFNLSAGGGTLVARGTGLASGTAVAPGLGVQVLGGAVSARPGSYRAYGSPVAIALELQFGLFASTGPRHLLFSSPDDIFVLPHGIRLVDRQPPLVSTITPTVDSAGARTVTITGANLFQDTRVYFDGHAALVRSFDEATGSLIVSPPPAPGGYRATVTASQSDGQSSLILQPSSPPIYTYDGTEAPFSVISPSSIGAGVEAMVEINGANTAFAQDQTIVGFGSSDVFVKRVWVLSPTRLWANVVAAPNTMVTSTAATVMTGFQLSSQPSALQIQAANPSLPAVNSQLVNAGSEHAAIYPGATVNVTGVNLTSAGVTTVSIGDRPAPVVAAAAGQVTFVMPSGLSPGPAILRLNNGADSANPVVVQIDRVPASVLSVLGPANTLVDAAHPAKIGDTVTIVLSGFADSGAAVTPSRVRVLAGGVEHAAIAVTPVSGPIALHQVQFTLSSQVSPGEKVSLSVLLDGYSSFPITIPVAAGQ